MLHHAYPYRLSFLFLFLLLITSRGQAQSSTDKNNAAAAAKQFLQTLDADSRKQANFDWTDAERFNWNFVPMARKGLPLKAMNEQQRKAALHLLQTCTSTQGYKKATSIMAMETVLKALENRGPDDHYRDPINYYFSIFGEPGLQKPWGWRVEGHHVSLNFTAVNNNLVAGTPAFFGSNPGIVPSGPEKGKQILKEETEVAFELLHALDKTQLSQAMIATDAPREIITGNKRKAMLLDPPGLPYGKMTSSQQQLLKHLVAVYVDNYTKLMADILLKEITAAGWDKMSFAWAGASAWGGGHYYRIQNPAILIEYDNTQNNGNHVHTVLRDLQHDFGEDLLQEHYQTAHKAE